MRTLMLQRIERERKDTDNFSGGRWTNFEVARRHIKNVDVNSLNDSRLIDVYTTMIHLKMIQRG